MIRKPTTVAITTWPSQLEEALRRPRSIEHLSAHLTAELGFRHALGAREHTLKNLNAGHGREWTLLIEPGAPRGAVQEPDFSLTKILCRNDENAVARGLARTP